MWKKALMQALPPHIWIVFLYEETVCIFYILPVPGIKIEFISLIGIHIPHCFYIRALIKMNRDWCYKKRTTTHINSTFNLFRSCPSFEATYFIQCRFPFCKHSWNSFLADNNQLFRCILLDCFDVFKSSSFESGIWLPKIN